MYYRQNREIKLDAGERLGRWLGPCQKKTEGRLHSCGSCFSVYVSTSQDYCLAAASASFLAFFSCMALASRSRRCSGVRPSLSFWVLPPAFCARAWALALSISLLLPRDMFVQVSRTYSLTVQIPSRNQVALGLPSCPYLTALLLEQKLRVTPSSVSLVVLLRRRTRRIFFDSFIRS